MDSGNENASKMECGCSGDCCAPKKNNTLKKVLFFLIVIAALTIVAMKFIAPPKDSGAATISRAGMVPVSADSVTDCSKTCSSENTSCCPQTK